MDGSYSSRKHLRKEKAIHTQRALLNETVRIYPFAVPDAVTLEHCLIVLYQNKEISALLQRIVWEQDAMVTKKKEKRARMAAR